MIICNMGTESVTFDVKKFTKNNKKMSNFWVVLLLGGSINKTIIRYVIQKSGSLKRSSSKHLVKLVVQKYLCNS